MAAAFSFHKLWLFNVSIRLGRSSKKETCTVFCQMKWPDEELQPDVVNNICRF